MLYYILFFALRVSSAAKQTCKIYHRQILYIIAVIVIFFFFAFYRIQYYSPPLPIYALLFNSRNFFSPSCP